MKYKLGPKGPTIIDERSKGKAATRRCDGYLLLEILGEDSTIQVAATILLLGCKFSQSQYGRHVGDFKTEALLMLLSCYLSDAKLADQSLLSIGHLEFSIQSTWLSFSQTDPCHKAHILGASWRGNRDVARWAKPAIGMASVPGGLCGLAFLAVRVS